MATMKGVVFPAQGKDPVLVDDLPKPIPGADQILVKSSYAAINPVDSFIQGAGLFVTSWPVTLGSDGAGVIVECGANVPSSFAVGTTVFGFTRLSQDGYGTCATYFLIDSSIAFPLTPAMRERGISEQSASGLGVAVLTAAIGIFHGFGIPLSRATVSQAREHSEYIVVLGGASSVGKKAIELALATGHKVIASCSERSASVVRSLGAEATVDYKLPLEQQVQRVLDVTDVNVRLILDAVAEADPVLAKSLFKASRHEASGRKIFVTTNDWSGIPDFGGGKTYHIKLGAPDEELAGGLLSEMRDVAVRLFEEGRLTPGEVEVVGGEDGEDMGRVLQAYQVQRSGKAGNKKVVVKIGDDK